MEKRALGILAGFLAVGLAGTAEVLQGHKPNEAPVDIPFQQIIIDSHAPMNQWCFSVGDLNGDGFIDVISSGSTIGKGGMVWYEYPTWSKHVIDSVGGFSDDLHAVDIDGDGDLDIVVPEMKASEVRWYENPGPTGNPATDPWRIHVIGKYSDYEFESAHDVEVGDLDGDGKVDVMIGNQKWQPPRPVNKPEVVIYFQNKPDSWTPAMISRTYGEGTAIADLNGDGRPDLVRPGYWLEAPVDPVHGTWTERTIIAGWPDRAGVTVADVNNDGHLDVLLAPAESAGRLSWFEKTDPKGTKWTEHVIDPSIDFVHTFKVADVDLDGTPDVVFSEMQQSARKRVGFYRNLDGKGGKWKLQVVGTTGSHNIRTVDIDRDGDIDIVGANWNSETDPNHAPMEMWRNLLVDQRRRNNLALDKWTYLQVDSTRGKWGDFAKPDWLRYFGLAFGDINRDGFTDIVSGRYVYLNPGGNMSGAWSRVTFPINVDAVLVTDVDGDGQPDIIGEAVPDVYWLKPLDAQGQSWNPFKIGTLPEGTDWNGQGYAVAKLIPQSDKPQIILSSGQGIFFFVIPADPTKDAWDRVQITSEAYDEGVGVGDINGDGLLDVSARYGKDGKNAAWWENPGKAAGSWAKHHVGHTEVEMDRNAIADLNGDRRPDIVVTEESVWSGDSVYWFEQPADPKAAWIPHKLCTQFTTNSMDVADINNDGSPEIITAEHRGSKKLQVWENMGRSAAWAEHVVSTGRENHLGARVADLDGDGDLDIVGIAWDGYQSLHLWRNDAILRLGGAQSVAAPVISPNGGNSSGPFSVKISTVTPGATIRYTLDGSEPTTSSALYVETLDVTGSCTLKARALKVGMSDSSVATAVFTTAYHY